MHAEFLVQRLRIVPNYFQTAAFGWPLWSESADDHISSRPYRAGNTRVRSRVKDVWDL